MISLINFGLSQFILIIASITTILGAPVSIHLNQKLCSFKASDYSLQWAYEPQSKNVVFVLKQRNELNNFWTGVGFGDRKKEIIDFIGVFVKNGQIGIADTHILSNEGTLTPDPSTNVQSIAFDYHNKTVTAKFARALKSTDETFDRNLDNCQIFNFAVNGGSISRSGIVPDFDEIAEKRICDIEKNCIVDIRKHLKTSDSAETTTTSLSSKGDSRLFSDNVKVNNKDDGLASMVMSWVLFSSSLEITPEKITKPEFAESVDISGTGDPCSFAGVGYTVNWTYNPETEMVDFIMKHPIRMGKWWSALGIGDTMAEMDIAIMFISSGRPKRIRDYFSRSYTVPEEDKQQDWILSRQRTKSIDEMIELGFSRKLETSDNDKDRTLDNCVLFQFAANAGHYGTGFAVRKHEEWPDLYKACDIKKHCIVKKEDNEKGETEISESIDNEDIIDEADDSEDEKIILKKRTQPKSKEEMKRQLEPSTPSGQTENEDGTSTTSLTIHMPNDTTAAVDENVVTDITNVNDVLSVTSIPSVVPVITTVNNEVTTPLSSEVTTTQSGVETTQVPTFEPVHIIPLGKNGELNMTMNDLRTAPPSSETTGETSQNFGENETSSERILGSLTTPIPAFGIQSTLQERPTTSASGEIGNAMNGAMGLESGGADEFASTTIEDNNAVTEAFSTFNNASGENLSTTNQGPSSLPATTTTINYLNPTLSFIPPLKNETETTSETIESTETTDDNSLSLANKNNIQTSTLSSNTKEAVSEAVETLGNLTESLNETKAKLEASVNESATLNQDEAGSTSASPNITAASEETSVEITTPGSVDIVGDNTVPTPSGDINVETASALPSGVRDLIQSVTATSSNADNTSLNTAEENELATPISETTTESETSEAGEEDTASIPNEATQATPMIGGKKAQADMVLGMLGLNNNTISPNISGGNVEVPTTSSIVETQEGKVDPFDAQITTVSSFEYTKLTSGSDKTVTETTTLFGTENENAENQQTTIDSDANGSTVAIGTLPEINVTEENVGRSTTQSVKLVTGGDSTEAGQTATNLRDILSSTTTGVFPGFSRQGLRDSMITEAASRITSESGATTPLPNDTASAEVKTTTQVSAMSMPLNSTNKVSTSTEVFEIDGSGEIAASSDAPTTPVPGPFDHRQQLINQLGPDAVGNPKEGCGTIHEDYSQCSIYFKNYLGRVQAWANENNEPMEDQYGKACLLLSQVQNVTTLCCSIFVETCKGKVDF